MRQNAKISKSIRKLKHPRDLASSIVDNIVNPLISLKKKPQCQISDLKELNEIRERMKYRTSIDDHLETLFVESLFMHPKLILELGVETGQSTFVFERVAKLCNSIFISVDINDCSKATTWSNWIFVQKDDINFAKEFKPFCEKKGLSPR